MDCPFCHLSPERIVDRNDLAIAILDGFPVSEGHTLLLPIRHVGSFFDATDDERRALLSLLDSAKQRLDSAFQPDAYNIGINDGSAAGQTIAHCHIHLIPRYRDDCTDPRGGVRWIFPTKAAYWSGR